MVSVVMATYNGEKYLIQQMDSIRTQTKKPDEVIICDDCSTDKTVWVVETYIAQYGLLNWKVIKNKINLGYYNNFFEAVKISRGQTIYLSDQDDIWDIHKIEKFEEFYDRHPEVTMIQSNMEFIDSDGIKINSDYKYHGKKEKTGFVEISTKEMCKFAGSGYTMSFRRSVTDKIFHNRLEAYETIYLYHDILIGLMSAALGKCYMCADVVDRHRLHSSNATQAKGKSYISNRTRERQLSILDRREKEFDLVANVIENEQMVEHFKRFSIFAKYRYELIKKKKIRNLLFLIKHLDLYSVKLGLVTDLLYSIDADNVLMKIYKWI